MGASERGSPPAGGTGAHGPGGGEAGLTPLHLAAALTVVTIWGVNFVAVKTAVTDLPPLFANAVRFFLVAACLIPFYRTPPIPWRPLMVLVVALGLCHFGVLFVGMQGVDVALGALCLQLGVPFSAILAWVMLGDRFGKWRALGMAVAFSGVAVVIGAPTNTSDPVSAALIIFAALAWAYANIVVKRLGSVNILALNAWIAAFAGPLLLLLSAVAETGQLAAAAEARPEAWLGVAFAAGASTIVGYGLWYFLLARYAVVTVAPFNLLTPFIAVLAGVALLGETMTEAKIIGGALTLIGVAIIQIRWRRPVPPAA